MNTNDIKRQIYEDLSIDDTTLDSWKEKDYSANMRTSLTIQAYAGAADVIIEMGDYDCDGVLGLHIYTKSFKSLYPNKEIIPLPPSRAEGYGISDRMVNIALDYINSGKKVMVITVDTGIAEKEKLEALKQAGCTIVLTDHHELKDRTRLPNVDLIVNPALTYIDNPLVGRNWCGAAIAFKLMENLVSPTIRNYCLGFAGIATIADVIELREGSWQLVRKALDSLRINAPTNLKMLINGLGKACSQLNEGDIGFGLAPCFNTPGRIELPGENGPEFVLEYLENPTEENLRRLIEKNEERKLIRDTELDMVRQKVIDECKENNAPIWIYVPNLHKGILGLISGQITQEFKTSSCICTNNESGTLTGSARSYKDGNGVYTFNMYEYLYENKDLLGKFGGHPGAAGFSLTLDNFKKIEDIYEMKLPAVDKNPVSIDLNDIPHINRLVNQLRPFGEGFTEPTFKAKINLKEQLNAKLIGENKNHLAITNATPKWKLIHFRHTETELQNKDEFEAIGRVHDSYYKGYCTPELSVDEVIDIDIREHENDLTM